MTLVLVLVGAGLGVGVWGLRRLAHMAILRGLRAPRVPHDDAIRALGLPQDRLRAVRLPGPGGRQLAAWLALPAQIPPSGAPAVLAMHGWGANASMMCPVVTPLLDAGMAVLLLDARCHGDSDDVPFTSMPRFAEDIDAALRWLRRLGDIDGRRIALLGHSVGAAAALLYAAHADTAQPVRAVISLAAFAHPQEMMRRWLVAHHLPYPVIGWYVLRHVQWVIGARFDDIAPQHTVALVTCPVMLVHGRDDTTVPVDDALRLQRVAHQGELDKRPWWQRSSVETVPKLTGDLLKMRSEYSRIPELSDPQLRELIANYYGMISLIDNNPHRWQTHAGAIRPCVADRDTLLHCGRPSGPFRNTSGNETGNNRETCADDQHDGKGAGR